MRRDAPPPPAHVQSHSPLCVTQLSVGLGFCARTTHTVAATSAAAATRWRMAAEAGVVLHECNVYTRVPWVGFWAVLLTDDRWQALAPACTRPAQVCVLAQLSRHDNASHEAVASAAQLPT